MVYILNVNALILFDKIDTIKGSSMKKSYSELCFNHLILHKG